MEAMRPQASQQASMMAVVPSKTRWEGALLEIEPDALDTIQLGAV